MTSPKLDKILNIATLIIGLLALYFAWDANEKAKEANAIAQDANAIAQEAQTTIFSITQVGYHGSLYYDIDQFESHPCVGTTNLGLTEVLWEVDNVYLFDISNLGGKPISLVDIRQKDVDLIETPDPLISAYAYINFFGTLEAFDNWYKSTNNNLHDEIYKSRENFYYSSPPHTINVGETIRVIFLINEVVQIDQTLKPIDVQNLFTKKKFGFYLYKDVVFIFADGTTFTKEIIMPYPYQNQSKTTNTEFEKCDE